ncbi:MAG: elongation factor 1-beta [Desulfurococcales archaeon ex4484_42]|nr:MAG: elongation factor 1-beta [Desulfurococcales archaeon ex4484_42]
MSSERKSKVLVVVRVNPESTEIDLEKMINEIKSRLPSEFQLVKSEKVYVAFGLYIPRLYIVMPEEYEGGTSRIEEVIKSVPGVSSIDIEFVTRTEAFSS